VTAEPSSDVTIGDLRWPLRLKSWLRRARRRIRRGAPDEIDSTPIVSSALARVALGILIASYIGFFVVWTLRQHYAFGTSGFDIGIFDQGVWLLSRGKEPFVTVLGLNLFGDHTSFILLLLVPFYWLAPSAATLLIAQSVALGAAAFPAFLIAREKLRHETLALLVALAYLAHPAVAHTNLENFHPDSFEVPFLLAVIYFMLKRRWLGYWICLAALLLIKEDVPLLTFVLGIYVAVRYDRRVGVITSLVSLAWFGAVLLVIFPALNGIGTLDAWRLPSAQFGGIGGLLRTAITRPWEIIGIALGPDKPWYLWQMFVSIGLMSFLAPGLLLVALGPLLSNLLSTFWYQYQIEYHYGTLIVPVLVAAAVFGIAGVRSMQTRYLLVGIMTVSAVTSAILWGPLPIGRSDIAMADPSTTHAQTLRRAIELIPDDAGVSAVHYVVPHLTHREHIYEFPVPWRAANWADTSREGERLPFTEAVDYVLVPTQLEPDLQAIVDSLGSEGFRPIYERDGIILLHRGSA
jgi:uncharacterized membrane protein